MQYAKPVKLRMRDCMNDEEANIGPAIIGLAIIVAMIWLCILIVKGIIAIVSYIFSVLSDVASDLVDIYFNHQDYIHSSEFLVHTLALVGGIYLASYLFIPFCKLVDSLMEIVVVLPFILVAWTFDRSSESYCLFKSHWLDLGILILKTGLQPLTTGITNHEVKL